MQVQKSQQVHYITDVGEVRREMQTKQGQRQARSRLLPAIFI